MQIPKTLYDALLFLKLDPNSSSALQVSAALVFNILGVSDAYACQRALNANVKFSALEIDGQKLSGQKFRLAVGDIAYLQLNLKFFVFNVLLHGTSSAVLRRYSRALSVPHNDVVLIKRILQEPGQLEELKQHPRIQEVTPEMVSVNAFKNVFSLFKTIHPVLLKHIRNKTYQKLRFVSISSNMEFYDLNMELMYKAVQSYVKIMPTSKTEPHVKAYLCRALNNHVVNMINAYTSQKRNRMERGSADGYGGYSYEVTTLSENQLMRAFGVEGLSYENLRSGTCNAEDERIRDSTISFEMILARFGTSPKRRAFIRALSIQEHRGFSRFLQSKRLISADEDNADFSAKCDTEVYIKNLCEYLDVSDASARVFMKRIATTAYPDMVECRSC